MTSSSRTPIVLVTASILSLGFLMAPALSTILKKKNNKRPSRRRRPSQSGIQIYCSSTPRNQKILTDAVGLTKSEPWGYANRHFASLMAQIRPWPSPFVVHSVNNWGRAPVRRIECLCTPAGCNIEVEYIEPLLRLSSSDHDTTPTVILLHGIGGSSREMYIEQAAVQFVEKGWKIVILNYSKVSVVDDNSVGGNCLTETHDISFLVSHLRKKHKGFLCCVGFSMGGTKMVSYLLRTKEHCNIDAACTVSSPLDFTQNNDTVHQPYGSYLHTFYHWIVSSYLKLWILRHYNELKKHHRVKFSEPFRRTRSGLMFWFKANSVPEIDRVITMRLNKRKHTCTDDDLNAYYNEASGIYKLGDGMKIPYLCITSLNDPFIPQRAIPPPHIAHMNENVFLVNTTKLGGHIGYWLPQLGCWATHAALSFFESVLMHEPNANREKPKYVRQSSSIDAAHLLHKSSITGLTNYFDFIDDDSCSDLVEEQIL